MGFSYPVHLHLPSPSYSPPSQKCAPAYSAGISFLFPATIACSVACADCDGTNARNASSEEQASEAEECGTGKGERR